MAKRTQKSESKGVFIIAIVLILLGLFLLHRTQQAGRFHPRPASSRGR
ncbi:MAG TPA: hypothetical protein VGS59_12885 [Candidatus Acidoferrales bacterium]|nr:hypothetical protein [Candidatus Acidoferrales bacterium]